MTTGDYILTVALMGLVTYGERFAPLFFLARRELPAWLSEWLSFVPATVLAALVVPALLTSGEPRHLDLFNPQLFVAVPTFLFALKTRSLAGTVFVGMALYWLAGRFFPGAN